MQFIMVLFKMFLSECLRIRAKVWFSFSLCNTGTNDKHGELEKEPQGELYK